MPPLHCVQNAVKSGIYIFSTKQEKNRLDHNKNPIVWSSSNKNVCTGTVYASTVSERRKIFTSPKYIYTHFFLKIF